MNEPGKAKGAGEFDFDTPVNRRGIFSEKRNCAEGELPMWVADMDFATAPAIMDALRRRVEAGTFGYSIVPDAYRESVAGWWHRRHDAAFDPGHVMFCTGVIPALASAITSLTGIGDHMAVQSPVYNNFYTCIRNTGRNVSENRLVFDGNTHHIDFENLERRLADPSTTLSALCNPQNPSGAAWSRDDLARIGELCARRHATVVSD